MLPIASPPKRRLTRLLLSCLVLLFGLVCLELSLMMMGLFRGPRNEFKYEEDGHGGLAIYLHGRSRPAHMVEISAAPRSGTRRVVMVGDSTIYGLHLRSGSTIADFLEVRLGERLGGDWEVVNLGASGFNARRVRQVAEFALEELTPEFLVAYTGHNEFLLQHPAPFIDRVQHPILDRLLSPWTGLRTGRALRSTLLGGNHADWATLTAGRPNELLVESVIEPARELVLDHYQEQVAGLIDAAEAAGAELILVEPASNGREFGPVASAFSSPVPAEDRADYSEGLQAAAAYLHEGQADLAASELEALLEVDSQVAELLHLRAALAWQRGEVEAARQLDLEALGRDEYAVASSAAVLDRLRQAAAARGQATTVVAPWLERVPAAGEPPTFIDHVHPSVYGQYLMACLVTDEIAAREQGATSNLPTELEERLLDFRRSCEVLELSKRHLSISKHRRVHGVVSRAAIALDPRPHLERAREILAEIPSRHIMRSELVEAYFVLVLLEGDPAEILTWGEHLRTKNSVRYERMLQRIPSHARLSACLARSGLHIEEGTLSR